MVINNQYLSVFSDRYTQIYRESCIIKHEEITNILNDVKSSLDIDFVTKKRIYSIVNELLENTMLHSDHSESEVELVILKTDDCYRIITINTISVDERHNLLSYSTNINSLSIQELKNQYKEKLLNGEINDKGTIGVGMELIRLQSNNKILISTDDNSNVIIDVRLDKL
ncbi:hypothetical protein CW751_13670 [Brumimicrobium salinarum]|uniref:Histidine kinase/HSP90-like ATPase domain-containing protein n=1 Tax=Brumimicrobium salinarum TaxID=2058658 RepID=A0A2I0QZC5_9FLAO|nr:DUF6272 family protein [Brumimicrobium salinarum]PKR79683.1 hypothetical protein CW751_13670 [Brumimicrobium salinarum]